MDINNDHMDACTIQNNVEMNTETTSSDTMKTPNDDNHVPMVEDKTVEDIKNNLQVQSSHECVDITTTGNINSSEDVSDTREIALVMDFNNDHMDACTIQNNVEMNTETTSSDIIKTLNDDNHVTMVEDKTVEGIKNNLQAQSSDELVNSRTTANNESLAGYINDKPNTNTALNLLMTYQSSEDSESDSVESISSDDSITDSDSETDTIPTSNKKIVPPKAPRVRGELDIKDLPPVEDLHISVKDEECIEIGKVSGIVDELVCVQSNVGMSPVDLDSVLFLDKGDKPLGKVFDVLGRVSEPIYCVRFNSNKEIIERNINRGDIVYIAPKSKHTSFIFLPDLLKIKGSDASWEHDTEPPAKFIDYSDDEEERNARRAIKNKDAVNTSEVDLQTQNKNVTPRRNTVRGTRHTRGSGRGLRNQNQYDNRNIRPASFNVPTYNFQGPTSYNNFATHQPVSYNSNTRHTTPNVGRPQFGSLPHPNPSMLPNPFSLPQPNQHMLPNPFSSLHQNQSYVGYTVPWNAAQHQNVYNGQSNQSTMFTVPPPSNVYNAPPPPSNVYNASPQPSNVYNASPLPISNVYSSPVPPSNVYSAPPPPLNVYSAPPAPPSNYIQPLPPGTF